jgi:UDP-N-acetylglucosamine enolpyruvyl transferase
LKLMAASLLAEGTTTLVDVPDILDVRIMAELLRRLGCVVSHDASGGVVSIDVPAVPEHRADYDLVRAMRASIGVLGPLTVRCGAAQVALPGGDAIAPAGWTCTSAVWRRWAPRSGSTTASSSRRRRKGCGGPGSGSTSRAWGRPRRC